MQKNTYLKGHKPTKEVIEKRRQGILKRGYKHPPEVIEKINKTKKERGAKAKIVFDNINGIYYSSAVEAAELLNIPYQDIDFSKHLFWEFLNSLYFPAGLHKIWLSFILLQIIYAFVVLSLLYEYIHLPHS